jgi:hypothetical protein
MTRVGRRLQILRGVTRQSETEGASREAPDILRSNHHLRAEAVCMDGSHQADRVTEAGAEEQHVAIAFGNIVDDRSEILGRQRIGGLVDDLKTVFLSIGFRAENGIARKLGVRGYEYHRPRPGFLLCGECKEPFGQSGVWIRPGRGS